MTIRSLIRRSALAAGVVTTAALVPSTASAQGGIGDVIMAGRAHGVELPASTVEYMHSLGPDAFEFRHVWKGRAAQVSERRAAFDAAQRQVPTRGAAVVRSADLQRAGAVLDGTFRMPVLLGQPSGASSPNSAAAFQQRLFGDGAGAYSLTELYAEMSNGMLNFTGDVIGWVPLAQNATFYYGTGNTGDQIFGNTPAFIVHTLTGADVSVNFGLYDNDGPDGVPNSGDDDGFVDLAAFMFPNSGRECGGSNPGIWAHRHFLAGWGGVSDYTTNDPAAGGGFIQVSDYIIQGGHNCNATTVVHAGLVAHESGHGFGLPDLYDTDDSNGDSEGIGEWGLMGSGNWNLPESPAHMEAWSKNELGWIDVVTLSADTTITIEPIFDSFTAYRLETGLAREYFLLENRQRLGADQHLNGTGLLIWHVDSVTIAQNDNGNRVNGDETHKGLDLEEADGLNHLDQVSGSGGNRGDAGDSWPGSSNRTTFDGSSNPNSSRYGNTSTGLALTGITETAGGDIVLTVNVPDLVTYGDVNDDDVVTAADLDVVSAYTVGVVGPDYSLIDVADVDDDGDVDARDAFIIHAYVLGRGNNGFRVGQQGIE